MNQLKSSPCLLLLVLAASGCSEDESRPNTPTVALYKDCDGDGYAAADAAVEAYSSADAAILGATATDAAVEAPRPALPKNCSAWTMRAPAAGAADCDDANADYHPNADFGVADETGNGDLNCDGIVEKKWRFDAQELRLDSFYGTGGEWKICDVRGTSIAPRFPANTSELVSARDQCPCYVEWVGDESTGSPKWTTEEFPCSPSTAIEVIPVRIRRLNAVTCQPEEKLFPGVQRCR